MRADVLTEENVSGGPGEKSRNTGTALAFSDALGFSAAGPTLPLFAAAANASTTGRLKTATVPIATLHNFAMERTLAWDSPWPVMPWQFADGAEAADRARHAVLEQVDAQIGPARSASVIRHATVAMPFSENRFV